MHGGCGMMAAHRIYGSLAGYSEAGNTALRRLDIIGTPQKDIFKPDGGFSWNRWVIDG